eukprot:CAMPEP_0204824820 /NCGR_PEP_ID=MMETSP1346-20131115/2788_1 /ASSEMBLY_ACC=CAM_ASM_000771 /TAXON_ID=215587 /ORGANISM="Aplanochytrium stocchinoi, Strain GSBS06" /LENGTH=803 /DNA_ID=CAMNT_0051952169 /DNA_START=287 /DNA_END=2698 /DNA_ORIENTATION=-
MKIIVGPKRSDAFKFFVTAQFANVQLKASRTAEMPTPVFQTPSLLSKENTLISGSNAICKYLIDSAKAAPLKTDKESENWLEWEEALAPYTSCLMGNRGDYHLQQLDSYLKSKKEAVESLGDVCVACTLLSARKNNKTKKYLQQFTATNEWLDKIAQISEFQKGIQQAETAQEKLYSSFNLDNILKYPETPFQKTLTSIIKNAVFEAFPMLGEDVLVQIEEGSKSIKGSHVVPEYQLSIAMKIAGLLKAIPEAAPIKSPRAVAEILTQQLKKNEYFMSVVCEKMEITGPGFLCIYLKGSLLVDIMVQVINSGKPQQPKLDRVSKVGVDFSSPNVAKEMHVGHLRSTIIGDTVCRILSYRGHEVKRINHIGDWGTQFGMLLTYLYDSNTSIDEENTTIGELNVIYKAAKKKFDEDEDFKTRSRQEVVRLQSGDERARKMWGKLIAVSERAFNIVYDKLGVKFPDGMCGESFYQSRIPGVVKELTDLGLVEPHGGAKIIKTSISKVPLFLQKSDGGFGYDSTDMAAIRYRTKELKMDWLIYVTDLGQGNHFQSCFEASRKAGYISDESCRVDHVGFGLVLGADGKRFRSRSGETVALSNLLDEAKDRIKKELEERVASGNTPLKLDEIDHAASVVGFAAVKYADLKSSKEKDYIFDYDLMLQPTGNTGVYILYTYARLCSIESKVEAATNRTVEAIVENRKSKIVINRCRPREFELASQLIRYGDNIERTASTLSPHFLCAYIYEICVAVSKFYTEHKLLVDADGKGVKGLDVEHGEDWVCLLHAVRLTLKELVPLLGMELLERI